jgi:hypothetical protein
MEELNDAVKEFLIVLENCEKSIKEKIPQNVLEYFQELASNSNKIFYIDKTKKLSNQNLSEECKNIISMVYFSYIASASEKEELKQAWIKNDLL